MKKEPKYIKLVPDFFNKAVKELDAKYFPDLKFYRDSDKDIQVHYQAECFSNGVLTYTKLINRLAKNCGDTKANIHKIVSKYIETFGDYNPKF